MGNLPPSKPSPCHRFTTTILNFRLLYRHHSSLFWASTSYYRNLQGENNIFKMAAPLPILLPSRFFSFTKSCLNHSMVVGARPTRRTNRRLNVGHQSSVYIHQKKHKQLLYLHPTAIDCRLKI